LESKINTFFITSTGTGIGKTYLTASLCFQLNKLEQDVHALKPIISGFSIENPNESDSAILLASMGKEYNEESINKISPWRFKLAASPDIAARLEGREIITNELIDFCSNYMRITQKKEASTLLIEGIGGAMVPINSEHTVLDWIKLLNIKCILVSGSYLGCISHTLTTFEAMQTKGLTPKSLVISESEDSPVSLYETEKTLKNFLKDTPIFVLERHKNSPNTYWQDRPDITNIIR